MVLSKFCVSGRIAASVAAANAGLLSGNNTGPIKNCEASNAALEKFSEGPPGAATSKARFCADNCNGSCGAIAELGNNSGGLPIIFLASGMTSPKSSFCSGDNSCTEVVVEVVPPPPELPPPPPPPNNPLTISVFLYF